MRIKERRRAGSQGLQERELIGAGPAQHAPLPVDNRTRDAVPVHFINDTFFAFPSFFRCTANIIYASIAPCQTHPHKKRF